MLRADNFPFRCLLPYPLRHQATLNRPAEIHNTEDLGMDLRIPRLVGRSVVVDNCTFNVNLVFIMSSGSSCVRSSRTLLKAVIHIATNSQTGAYVSRIS